MAKGVKKGGHFWTPFWTPYVSNSPLKCVSFDQKGVKKGVQKVVKKGPKLDIAIWGVPPSGQIAQISNLDVFCSFFKSQNGHMASRTPKSLKRVNISVLIRGSLKSYP